MNSIYKEGSDKGAALLFVSVLLQIACFTLFKSFSVV
jgi:hypothetical protein